MRNRRKASATEFVGQVRVRHVVSYTIGPQAAHYYSITHNDQMIDSALTKKRAIKRATIWDKRLLEQSTA